MSTAETSDTLSKIKIARNAPDGALKDYGTQINMTQLRSYRLRRVQEEVRKRDYAGCILRDPINIRYATGSRNYQVWQMHFPARYAFVPASGTAILFELFGTESVGTDLEGVGEVRPATAWLHLTAGPRIDEKVKRWAADLAEVIQRCGGGKARVAIDKCDPLGVSALAVHGVTVCDDGQTLMDHARLLKSPEEIACMSVAITVAETGIARMREALRPGITENELWAILHHTNIANDGDFIDAKLLSSGGRTNPWWREATAKAVRAGELVAFDTDMVGPFGYEADISRTFHCGPGRPNQAQKTLYKTAVEQLHFNIELMRPGASFRDVTEKSWRVPPRYLKNQYYCIAHGIGMGGEFPHIYPKEAWDEAGFDGVIEENMCLCVESYIGEKGGIEGVKLEQQVLIASDGPHFLSTFPFEDELLA